MTHVIVLFICLSFLRKGSFKSTSFPGDLPVPPAEASGVLPNLALQEPDVAVEQAIETDLNKGNMVTADSDTSFACQEELEHSEAIGEDQSKPTGDVVDTDVVDTDIVDQDKNEKHGQFTDTDIDDPDLTARRSERLRRPPKRFHYDELGKPLISFAKSFLESFNRALDTIGDDGSLVVQRTKHEGTHADLRREGVTSMKNQVTNPIFVI